MSLPNKELVFRSQEKSYVEIQYQVKNFRFINFGQNPKKLTYWQGKKQDNILYLPCVIINNY